MRQIIITMRAILLLAVGAAALKAPKQTALAVRGGGDDNTNEIIMKVSAAATSAGALTILDKSDLVEKYIFFGLNPATSGAAYGVALWAGRRQDQRRPERRQVDQELREAQPDPDGRLDRHEQTQPERRADDRADLPPRVPAFDSTQVLFAAKLNLIP